MVTERSSESFRTRAVRGATTVERDEVSLIREAVRELLLEMLAQNDIDQDSIISAMFTATPDLRSVFPASAARELGWTDVPMLCASEIDVPNAQPRCLRVMLHVERRITQDRLVPVYMREAVSLRPDLNRNTQNSPAMASVG
jgi:chorismate mutase